VSPDPAVTAIAREQARQAELVADLQLKVKKLESDKVKGYLPKPSVKFWDNLTDEEIRAEVGKLRGWYENVAMVVLAAPELMPCTWTQHRHVWTILDTTSELWATLWLSERRTPQIVSAQAEFTLRIWPGLLEIIVRETTRCSHQNGYVRLAGRS
jgi:hypothetical protein